MSEIRQLTINNRVLGIVEVPEGYEHSEIVGVKNHNLQIWLKTPKHPMLTGLPEPFNWRILGLAGELEPEVGRDKKYDASDTSVKSMAWHEDWHIRREIQTLLQRESIKPNNLILIKDEN